MNNKEPRDIRVEYGPAMFYMAQNIIVERQEACAGRKVMGTDDSNAARYAI